MEQSFAILVIIDIVDSTKFIEKAGDMRAAKTMRLYDRIFRGLLIKYAGLEIDKTDGALLLFESMRDALRYVTEYHTLVEKHLGLKSRVGIHCGDVIMHSNAETFVSRGAKPIEVEGITKNITARIMTLAQGGQTLMSKRAGEYAQSVKGSLLIKDIGRWRMKGVSHSLLLYAVSHDKYRLSPPKETDKVKRVQAPARTPEEQRIRFFKVWILPYFYLILLREYLMLFAWYEHLQGGTYLYLDVISRYVSSAVRIVHSLFYY